MNRTEDAKSTDAPARIIHLIPQDGLGGVESAARSFAVDGHVQIQVWFMAGASLLRSSAIREVAPLSRLNSIKPYFLSLFQLWKVNPEIVIVSLWRARLVGLIYKMLRPRVRLVSMIHSTRFTHVVDKWITHASVWVAEEVWFDSQAALSVFRGLGAKRSRVISFLVRITNSTSAIVAQRRIDFAFWGRLAPGKDVPRAIAIFDQVKRKFPVGYFYIYGPDDGDLGSIVKAISASADPGSIRLMGTKLAGEFPSPIPECTFFLMTSNAEGMAVSVVEAMQLGLIPIVTPVGEIPNYCVDGVNALLVSDDDLIVPSIISLAQNAELLSEMSESASSFWLDKVDYGADFEAACHALLLAK